MSGKDFGEVVNLIVKEDSRFDRDAYFFLRHGLDHTLNKVKEKEESDQLRHVTGQELCEGIREYAIEQFGPMTMTLMETWGLRKTADFGEMVFNLVEYGVFGKTESDRKEDFEDVYDFDGAFAQPFRPKKARLATSEAVIERSEAGT